MKGDYSKISFDERKKMQHYRKVYLQQGKVLLDSDLNENTDLLHYQMKTLAKDGLCGSPNIGFRIGRGVPLLPVDDHRYIGKGKGWDVDKGTLTIDYFNKFEGKGSLELKNATINTEVSFEFQKPLDLSKYRYLRLALKSTDANPELILNLFDGQNETTIIKEKQEQSTDQNKFSMIKYTFPPDVVLDNITKIYWTGFNSDTIYNIGAVECSPPMFTLEPMTHIKGWDFNPAGSAEISTDGEGINASQVTELYKEHFSSVDFSKFETLEFAIKCSKPYDIQFYVSDVEEKTSYWDINIVLSNGLKKYWIENLQKSKYSDTPANLKSIKKYGFRSLHTGAKYHFGSILYEMSLKNNFVISGAEPLSGESGRLYVDGELYEKEEAETYLNQKDCPSAPSITQSTALVYVDVWQRHVTSAEDPELREVAVGVDTCNRMKAVAQVKVLSGVKSLPSDLKPTGSGRLTTSVEYMEAEKLCEITPGVEYTGLENRLYRVEIHTPGKVGSAAYKWSRNNASTVSQIIENVEKGATSVKVKDVKLFEIGDIIEIIDDRVEFADRKYINNESSIKPWGELRRITSIDRNKNEMEWDTTASDDPLSMTGGLPHDYTAEGGETIHPRVIKWDGTNKTSIEETLEGIKIKFSGSGMLPGDYWTFTARENTRAVERLDNEPPQGVVHRYYPLATIEWGTSGEIISIEDQRTRFEPLCGLTAADLAFDHANKSKWKDAENVQQALEREQDPNASGVQFVNKCNFLYGEDVNNVQAALDNLCNGITVPSLTLKGKDKEQSKWPKLECSDSGDISFLTGLDVNGFTKSLGISVNNGANTGVGRGLWLWSPSDSNHVIYSANPNGKSPANKNAVVGYFDDGHRLRFRTAAGQGFLFENNKETALVDIDSDDGRLWTRGAIYSGNSDLYFTKTDHKYTAIGNATGFAAIENAENYDALMILGRAGTSKGRYVRLWDYLQVNGGMDITGNVGIGPTSPENAEGWSKVLDILGATTTKLSVRTTNIDARVLSHEKGWWGAPAGMIIGTKSAHPLSFGTNATSRMTIDEKGNVSIGTTSLTNKLKVNGKLKLPQGAEINEFSTDGTLSDRSDSAVPTEKAVKSYVDKIQSGVFHVGEIDRTGERTTRDTIYFKPNFSSTPKVVLGVTSLDVHKDHNLRYTVYYENLTKNAFTIIFKTWSDTHIYGGRVQWMAYGPI